MIRTSLVAFALLTMLLTGCSEQSSTDSQSVSNLAAASTAKTSIIGKMRPDFSLPDVEGITHPISEWDGKVLVINFWATWCPPCRKETPAFVALQEKYGAHGLQFIGVAIDEKDPVIDFMDTYGVNYPMLLGELDAIEIGKQYGNRFGALPYTVVIDRTGKIAFVIRGEFTSENAEAQIKPLL